MIPDKNPETLEECFNILEKIKYAAYGYPLIFIDYHTNLGYWGVVFRSPVNFDNPIIREKTPLLAIHKMLDFLRDIQNKRNMRD